MQGFDLDAIVQQLSVALIPLLFAITLHEVAHGWVAKRCGDPTALFAGRLTLNPLKHIDPVGTVLVPGRATGPLVGGCLSSLVALLGTPYAIETEGRVLLLEDVAPRRLGVVPLADALPTS